MTGQSNRVAGQVRAGVGLLVAVTALVLAGCSDAVDSSTPAATPSEAPTEEPSPTPAPGPIGDDTTSAEVTAGDRAMLARFVEFSVDPDAASATELGLAPDGVQLGLGDRLLLELPVASADDPSAWEISEPVFRGRSGPFSALDVLARRGGDGDALVSGTSELVVTVGDHPHCVSPPVPPPPEVAELRRIAVQPPEDAMGSCLDWFTVDFFVDRDGAVAAITLDLWEP